MTKVEQAIRQLQQEWDEMYHQHRLLFATELPGEFVEWIDGWILKDVFPIKKYSCCYYALFQKGENEITVYSSVASSQKPELIRNLGCMQNRKSVFSIHPVLPKENQSLSLTSEDLGMLRPFFEKVSRWMIASGLKLDKVRKEDAFDFFEQEMLASGVDQVVREKDGHMNLQIGEYLIPIGYHLPKKLTKKEETL